MSLYVVNSEYDMDLAVDECMKLVAVKDSTVKVAFNTMPMFHVFFENFRDRCIEANIDPTASGFHLDIMIEKNSIDDSDEDTLDVG